MFRLLKNTYVSSLFTSLCGLTDTRRTPGVSLIVQAVSRNASCAIALAAWPAARGGTLRRTKGRLCHQTFERNKLLDGLSGFLTRIDYAKFEAGEFLINVLLLSSFSLSFFVFFSFLLSCRAFPLPLSHSLSCCYYCCYSCPLNLKFLPDVFSSDLTETFAYVWY